MLRAAGTNWEVIQTITEVDSACNFVIGVSAQNATLKKMHPFKKHHGQDLKGAKAELGLKQIEGYYYFHENPPGAF